MVRDVVAVGTVVTAAGMTFSMEVRTGVAAAVLALRVGVVRLLMKAVLVIDLCDKVMPVLEAAAVSGGVGGGRDGGVSGSGSSSGGGSGGNCGRFPARRFHHGVGRSN